MRVKDLACGDNPGRLETSAEDALDRLHEEGLRRASTFVRRHRLGRIGVAEVRDWREIHERVNLRRPQMARDGDDFGEAKSYDFLRAERRREIPLAPWRRIGEELQLVIRKYESPACITLARQARSPCRVATIERYR